jgi:hypothetical protein
MEIRGRGAGGSDDTSNRDHRGREVLSTGRRGVLPTTIEAVPVDVRQASPHKRETLENLGVGTVSAIDPPTGALPEFTSELTPTGHPVTASFEAVAAVAAGKPQIPYSAPDVPLNSVSDTVTVQACASPDAGWPMLNAFLGSVDQSLTTGLYDCDLETDPGHLHYRPGR